MSNAVILISPHDALHAIINSGKHTDNVTVDETEAPEV